MTAPLSPDETRILKSLLSWWEEAGVEMPDIPAAARSEPSTRPGREAAGAVMRQTPSAAPARPAATAARAREAGFGAEPPEQDGREMAGQAQSLDALKAALDAFEGCPLKTTAKSTVFARGNPEAAIMVVGEAPGREEDDQGQPFVGRSGQLLDRMFAAIGLDESQLYITNIVNWRPPGNRKPTDAEIAACLPFAERHIALAKPKLLVFAGGISAQTLLRAKSGIMSLRGRWTEYRVKDEAFEEAGSIPALPIFHPAFLLRRPQEKRRAWADMLSLQERLETL
ncbi:DNA polymerase [Marinicauda pacifica]|jgi:uracil-DNA glycosylase|uniref:Type-4 uracil-DNA glycosylase n=1 Tax=Marinicauda pacifica TaxID=1133559 RepID=A0A4V3RZM2_9PROT|nr:uracil-DNA glycosylase [Marinicauda pacifica]TGY94799.1 uracil-DNA glycosylase [Marinicauda pacifica]GGE38915.1 DNA polymerase [Marinicauda pacifica]